MIDRKVFVFIRQDYINIAIMINPINANMVNFSYAELKQLPVPGAAMLTVKLSNSGGLTAAKNSYAVLYVDDGIMILPFTVIPQ